MIDLQNDIARRGRRRRRRRSPNIATADGAVTCVDVHGGGRTESYGATGRVVYRNPVQSAVDVRHANANAHAECPAITALRGNATTTGTITMQYRNPVDISIINRL